MQNIKRVLYILYLISKKPPTEKLTTQINFIFIRYKLAKYIILTYRKIKNTLIFFLSIPEYLIIFIIIIFFLILRSVIKIKIFELETRAIGAFGLPTEIFLCEKKLGLHSNKKNEFIVCFPNNKISNLFLFKKFKQNLFVVPILFFKKIFFLSNTISFFKLFLSSHRNWRYHHNNLQYVDIHDVLSKTKPIIDFSNEELEEGRKFLESFDIKVKDSFFCFNARSKYYASEIDNSCRNSDINLQVKGIENIVNENFKAFRMGSVKQNPIITENKNIIDYTNLKERSDFLDIYLLFNCKFMVSTGTGLDTVPLLNRKKVLYVNYYLQDAHHQPGGYVPIIVPKKFMDLKTKILIPYSEVFDKNLLRCVSIQELNKLGYNLIDNSKNEILAAIKEMYELSFSQDHAIDDEYSYKNKNLEVLNKNFWNYYEKKYLFKPRPRVMSISENFLHNNFSLFI
jgi:putative glycosyltransferase (TIGR04372 family)